jgi:hypothetical protein
VDDDATHQQLAVAGEQDPGLGHGDVGELVVVRLGPVPGVEPEQAEPPGQRAEVDVEHEPARVGRVRPRPLPGGEVEVVEGRVDRDPRPAGDEVTEPDRVAVDDQQADLRVGHTDRLDQVLDRPRSADGHGELGLAGQLDEVAVDAHLDPHVGDATDGRHAASSDPQAGGGNPAQ